MPISCVAAPACTLGQAHHFQRIAGVLSRPAKGLWINPRSGAQWRRCQPNTGTGTASTNDSPVAPDQGVWAQMHQHCCATTLDLEYLIFIEPARWSGRTLARRELPVQKGGQAAQALGRSRGQPIPPKSGFSRGPGSDQDSRERGRLGQPLAIHPDRRATARHHPGGGVDRRLCWRARTGRQRVHAQSFASTSWNWV